MDVRKRGAGRPPKQGQRVSNYPVMAYMPDEEAYEMVREAAEQQNMTISAWARNVLIQEARRVLGR
jgi:hypothetical protein